MDYRWEAVAGLVSLATVFVPVFAAIFIAFPAREQVKAARERRIANYRKSAASRILILDAESLAPQLYRL